MNIPAHQIVFTVEQRKHPGGQTVGNFPSGVTAEHIPSGLVATSKHARSQLKNKQIATEMIEYGLLALGYDQSELDRLTPEAMRACGLIPTTS